MKRLFAIFSFLLLPLFSIAADGENFGGLVVEWISAEEVVIRGGTLGGGDGTGNYKVITNFFGECTNCVNIAPEDLRVFKFQINDLCETLKESFAEILNLAQEIQEKAHDAINEISHYVRFDISSQSTISISSNYYYEIIRQDYDLSYIHGNQGELTYNYFSQLGGFQGSTAVQNNRLRMSVAYSNGIYDFSNNVDVPTYNQIISKASEIEMDAQMRVGIADQIDFLTQGLSEDPCQCSGGSGDGCNGGSGSGGGSFDCPCKEQLEALRDYTSHIDDDLHLQKQHLVEMKEHLGNVDDRLKSYCDAITSVFLNDGTIVVDTGANSWTSVYNNGYSELYGYNKSNILQRIELLLYGLAFSSSSSTNLDADVSTSMEDYDDRVSQSSDDALSTIEGAADDYQNDVRSVGDALGELWSNLNFLGAGQLQNFSLMEPTRVFDEYDLEFEFTRSSDFSDLRTIVRTSFQVFYLLSTLVFIIVFWVKVVRFIYDKSLFVLDFFNKVLT